MVFDVAWLAEPDCEAVDALARLQLRAMRAGYRLRLRGATRQLRELIALSGLEEVLPCVDDPPSGADALGQSEEGEPARRVEEERDPGDPIA